MHLKTRKCLLACQSDFYSTSFLRFSNTTSLWTLVFTICSYCRYFHFGAQKADDRAPATSKNMWSKTLFIVRIPSHALQSRWNVFIKFTGALIGINGETWAEFPIARTIFAARSRVLCSNSTRLLYALFRFIAISLFFAVRCSSASMSCQGIEKHSLFSFFSTLGLPGALWWLEEWNICCNFAIRFSTQAGIEAEGGDDGTIPECNCLSLVIGCCVEESEGVRGGDGVCCGGNATKKQGEMMMNWLDLIWNKKIQQTEAVMDGKLTWFR